MQDIELIKYPRSKNVVLWHPRRVFLASLVFKKSGGVNSFSAEKSKAFVTTQRI